MIKKTILKGKNLFIDNDLTKKERDIQNNIMDLTSAERRKGTRVKVGYRKVQINDQFYVWKD